MNGFSPSISRVMLGRNSHRIRAGAVYGCFTGWFALGLIFADEAEFESYYKMTFGDQEVAAERIRKTHGDASYLLTLFTGNIMMHIDITYRTSGAHPEIEPPDRTPKAGESPAIIMLNTAREFSQKHYLDMWASAYLIEGEPFSKEAKRILTSIFEEDLFVQRRAQEIARLYGEDDIELIAGFTGRELVAYMEKHLPEPDPRALVEKATAPRVKSRLNPGSAGSEQRDPPDGSGSGHGRVFAWGILALLVSAGLVWGSRFLRGSRSADRG